MARFMCQLVLPSIFFSLSVLADAQQGDGQCLLQRSTEASRVVAASGGDQDVISAQADAAGFDMSSFLQYGREASKQKLETDLAHLGVGSLLQSVMQAPVETLGKKGVIASVATVVLAGLAFVAAGIFLPLLPRSVVSVLVISFYIFLSVTIDLLIMYQKDEAGSGATIYKFDPTCAIIVTESIKLVISLTLYTTSQAVSGAPLLPDRVSLSDVWLFFIPALFFTVNNIMVFIAIGGNDASAFGVFRDTMILWTALIWVIVFKASLGPIRLGGIAVIFVGLVVNRVGSISAATFNWAFLLVICMTVTNATGSVFNEYALKFNKALDINLQNAMLYSMCIGFSIIILACRSPVHLTSAGAFFEGFTSWTVLMVCLQASAGLLVSRLLKYADAVYKTIGTCLRGPALVFVAPFLLGSRQDLASLVSAFIVAAGCLTYLTQGPLSSDVNALEAKRGVAGGDVNAPETKKAEAADIKS